MERFERPDPLMAAFDKAAEKVLANPPAEYVTLDDVGRYQLTGKFLSYYERYDENGDNPSERFRCYMEEEFTKTWVPFATFANYGKTESMYLQRVGRNSGNRVVAIDSAGGEVIDEFVSSGWAQF